MAYDTYSVMAKLSAKEDSSFRSTFSNAQRTVDSLTGTIKSGFGMGIGMKIADAGISILDKGVGVLTGSLKGATDRYDTLKGFPRVMQQIGFGADDANKSTEKMKKHLDGLPTTLDDCTQNVQTMAIVTGDLDKSTDLVLALNDAMIGSGTSSEGAKRGMTQFTQALSKGKFAGDDWNTIMETMGPAVYKVAEYMGFNGTNAANDLRDALNDGRISTSDFCDAIIDLDQGVEISGQKFEGYESIARASTGGIGTSFTNLKTTVTSKMADMIKALDDKMAENDTSISGHMDRMKQIIKDTFDKIIQSPQFDKMADAFSRAFSYLEEKLPKIIDVTLELLGYMVDKGFEVADAFLDAGREIKETAEQSGTANIVLEGLKGVMDGVANVFKFAAKMLKTFKDPIVWTIQHIPELIKLIIGIKAAEKIVNKTATFIGFIKNVAQMVKDVKTGFNKIKDATESMVNKISKLFDKCFKDSGKYSDDFANTAKAAMDNVQKYSSNAKDAVSKIGTGFTDMSGVSKTATDNVNGALSGINTYASNTGSSVYNIGGKFTNVATTAQGSTSTINTSMGKITTYSQTVAGSVKSNIGGSFTNAASTSKSAIGGITGSLGGLMAGLGIVAGCVGALVTAIIKWKDEQYKAGQAMHEMTDENKQFLDSCKDTAKAFDTIRDSVTNSYADKEAELGITETLMGKYKELCDESGKVKTGQEELADTLLNQACESLGMEKDKIEELRGEYKNLCDSNGEVKQGYEERADEILTELASAWGLEKSDVQDIIGKNQDLIGVIGDVTEAKRENAKVEAITEAEKQAVKDQIELQSQQRQLTQLQKQAQEDYDAFLAQHGDNVRKYTDKERGEYDILRENLNKYNTALDENQIALNDTEYVQRVCGDAMVANAQGNTDELNNCWLKLTEGIKDHTNGTKEELQQQVFDAQEYLQQKKEAYEKNADETTQAEMDEAQKRYDLMCDEYNKLLDNQDGYLTSSLEIQRDAAQKELDDAQAKLKELTDYNNQYRNTSHTKDTTAAKEEVELKKKTLDQIEKDLQASLITQGKLQDDHNKDTEKSTKNHGDRQEAEIKDSLDDQEKLYENFATKIESHVDENGQTVVTITGKTGDEVERLLAESIGIANNQLSGSEGTFNNSASKAAGGVTSGFSVLNNIPVVVGDYMNQATNAIGNSSNNASRQAGYVATGVKNSMRNNLSSNNASIMGSNVVVGLQNGLNARKQSVINTAYNIASAVTSAMSGALQIGSPSKLTTQYGKWTGEGLVNGLNDKKKDAELAGKNIALATTDALSSTLEKTDMENILPFPDATAIANELNGIEAFRSPDFQVRQMTESRQDIVVEANLNVDGRTFTQTLASNTSRAISENKRRRRA